jgi:acetyltransferase-like isoleucine patch superfamily enzyme
MLKYYLKKIVIWYGLLHFWDNVYFCFHDRKKLSPLQELELYRKKLRKEQDWLYPQPFVNIGDFTYGRPRIWAYGEKANVKIGKFCSIANGVLIYLGGEHWLDWASTYPFSVFLRNFSYIKGYPKSKGDITIGNDVWIGSNAKIMSGVTIGDGAVIGANALVTKNVPDYAVWGGVPAKQIKTRFSPETITRLKETAWWDWPLENICAAIPMLQNNDIESLLEYGKTIHHPG